MASFNRAYRPAGTARQLVAVVAAQDAMEAELRYRRDAAYRAPVAAPASAVATPSVPMNTGGSFSALPRLI